MKNDIGIRSELVDFLHRELIGPDPRPEYSNFNNGDEVLRPQDPPRLRYSAGVLFPRDAQLSEQENAEKDEVENADSGPPEGEEPGDIDSNSNVNDTDEMPDNEINRANEFLPSAMGITALVRLPEYINVTVKTAIYEKKAVEGVGKKDKRGNWQPYHYRKAIIPPTIEIDCNLLKSSKRVTKYYPILTESDDRKLALHIYSRPYSGAKLGEFDRIVTFTLINQTKMSGASPKDRECFFQCEFKLDGSGKEGCFIEYPERQAAENDEEEQSLKLLYRHRKTFAIGHGCAVSWADTESNSTNQLKTEALPAYEISPIIPSEIKGLHLSMQKLSSEHDAASIKVCENLAKDYKTWIDQQESTVEADDFPPEYLLIARKHLEQCRCCHKRIRDGIQLLISDPDTFQAFAWMNEAMLQQQLHYSISANQRRNWVENKEDLILEKSYKNPDIDNLPKGVGVWRPFQLAFILMNLKSISQRESPERSIVDLIWFPTGGGKTEAYLGLSAFTIFRRRLFNAQDVGTTILMRYTLRLLTTQQFQRAASLICACELIRRNHEDRLGIIRISIGLWVGGDVTPNKHSSANPLGAVESHRKLLEEGKPNRFVVITCPWCGAGMGPYRKGNSYRAKGYRRVGKKIIFRCEDPDCPFSSDSGLPLLVVDEAIYEERPTLVVGTVDKFAMMPWYPEIRRLFGIDNVKPVSPPDLIIQDELHLISGALGSMVGLYETTIDALCQRNFKNQIVSAKIVASTATICQAQQQIHSLYAREVFLFPPQALRAGNSFFAKEGANDKESEYVPGRLYVGVFGSALSSQITAQIRVIAALLQAVKSIESSQTKDVLDPYWTLIVYFNSLRELGHAATLIRADIREYLNAMWDRLNIRKPTDANMEIDHRRFINRDLELTSRIQSNEITEVLQQLFNQYPGTDEIKPVDVCLATNMIQAGLDVPRLGLMTVIGQPKTTSEYIQVTSRVGRDAKGPGLVITIFNPGKPRDRSHFEHFQSYHQNIYRWVEPTSVTPFAIPVRERALHAQLVTLSRYWGGADLRERPNPAPNIALFNRISEILLKRIQIVDEDEEILSNKMLQAFESRWKTILPPIYGHFGPPPQETPLMYPSGTEPRSIWAKNSKATPSSMRNVDSNCDAEVIRQFTEPGGNDAT